MIATNSIKAWFLAARPKTLSAAAVPILIAIALAMRDCYLMETVGDAAQPHILHIPALLCLLFAWVMQIDSNFVNDYFDFKRGNDDETRLGPKRACAEGWITESAMKTGIIVTTLLGCAIGLPLVIYGGMAMIWVGVACVAFCFLYTTTFSYHGMGDILVLLFFGIVPVCCTYYVIMPEGYKTVSTEVVMAAIACGLVVDTLLVVNNFRDRDNDREAGKRTLIVKLIDRWDEKSALWLYLLLGYVPLAIMMGMGIHDAVVRDTSTFALPLYAVYAGAPVMRANSREFLITLLTCLSPWLSPNSVYFGRICVSTNSMISILTCCIIAFSPHYISNANPRTMVRKTICP